MKKIISCILLCLSFSCFADNFYLLSFSDTDDDILGQIHKHFKDNFESEHRIEIEDFKALVKYCNKSNNIQKIVYTEIMKFCLDKSFLSIWGGIGNFESENLNISGKSQTLKANAVFIGGQMIFSWKLDRIIILEGKYWYLPSFSNSSASAVENLRLSSYLEGDLYLQKRIVATPYSLRIGFDGFKAPVVRDNSTTRLLSQIDLQFKSALVGGVLIGFKYQRHREAAAKHSSFFDVIILTYADNRILENFGRSFKLRAGHKWYFHRNFAFSADLEYFKFFRKSGEQVTTKVMGVGLQAYLF